MGVVNHGCDVNEEDLGPLLLGQLDADRAVAVAAQVTACPTCRDEVERLRSVVAALARSSPPPVRRTDPSTRFRAPFGGQEGLPGPATRPPSGSRGRETRPGPARPARPTRRRLLMAVATAVLVVAASVVITTLPAPPGGGRSVALAGAGGAAASAVLQERRWGTAIELEVRGLDAGTTYGVWLERRAGGRLSAGSFRPDSDGTFRLSLAAALPLDDSRAVGVALLPGGRVADAVDVLTAALG